jgi:hypothetical protein
MKETVESQSPRAPAKGDSPRTVRNLLLLSAAALIAQVAITDYGPGNSGAAGLWLVIGCLLLWLVYVRRSRVARTVVVVTSIIGAVIYAFGAFGDVTAAVLVLAYVGQAVPLLLSPVRRHVSPASPGGERRAATIRTCRTS